jgi:hypothetical protein
MLTSVPAEIWDRRVKVCTASCDVRKRRRSVWKGDREDGRGTGREGGAEWE